MLSCEIAYIFSEKTKISSEKIKIIQEKIFAVRGALFFSALAHLPPRRAICAQNYDFFFITPNNIMPLLRFCASVCPKTSPL